MGISARNRRKGTIVEVKKSQTIAHGRIGQLSGRSDAASVKQLVVIKLDFGSTLFLCVVGLHWAAPRTSRQPCSKTNGAHRAPFRLEGISKSLLTRRSGSP